MLTVEEEVADDGASPSPLNRSGKINLIDVLHSVNVLSISSLDSPNNF